MEVKFAIYPKYPRNYFIEKSVSFNKGPLAISYFLKYSS